MTITDRQWALCVFDDLIEYCGPASARYQAFFLQPLLAYTEVWVDTDSVEDSS